MKNKIGKIIFLLLAFFILTKNCLAAEECGGSKGGMNYELLESVPLVGNAGEVVRFPEYVSGLYKFAFVAIIISALLMVTAGGFYWLMSAGNQSIANTSKKMITDALVGLVVAFISWLVLYTIDPAILSGKLDTSVMRVGLQSGRTGPYDQPGEGTSTDPTCNFANETGCGCESGAVFRGCVTWTTVASDNRVLNHARWYCEGAPGYCSGECSSDQD